MCIGQVAHFWAFRDFLSNKRTKASGDSIAGYAGAIARTPFSVYTFSTRGLWPPGTAYRGTNGTGEGMVRILNGVDVLAPIRRAWPMRLGAL